MKNLPQGNYMLTIAHPGHELRLHGFLEQAKPFVWILTDGSNRTGQDMMMDSIRAIDKASKHGIKNSVAYMKDEKSKKIFKLSSKSDTGELIHLKDEQIIYDIANEHTGLFERYIKDMTKNMIRYKTDFLVSDSCEEINPCHSITSIMADIACKLVEKQTNKNIVRYDFAIDKLYNADLTDESIQINLDQEAVERKLNAIIKYPFAISDLKPSFSLGLQVIATLKGLPDANEQIKQWMKDLNINFFRKEYLQPARRCTLFNSLRLKLEELILQ